jgi:16S rRNA (cytidine1402-2'-O)-methyltransferase
MIKAGTLYLCATPIGNLEDMTYRAVRVLSEVAAIAAEDTRHTRKLLSHYAIHTPLVSYHEHNKTLRGPELINRLLAGESLAVVSDAGLPGICDPGADLVILAVQAGITVSPVPGPTAALSAIVCSGLDTRLFLFAGFLPKTTKKRRERIKALAGLPYTLVLYESPHRVVDTLKELLATLGDRPAVAGRELTKKFEEFRRGTLQGLCDHFSNVAPRGEFTLIVAGNEGEPLSQEASASQDPVVAVAALVARGIAKKEAIRMVASEQGKSRREVYQLVLGQEKE